MNAGAVLFALALGAVAAGPSIALAQADATAPDADPACAAYQQTLTTASGSGDPAAFDSAAANIPAACPNLKKMAETVLERARQLERQEDSTEQAYHPPSAVFDEDTAIRGGSYDRPPGASADSAASSQAAQPPPTEPPGSYDAPPSSGDKPAPAQ